MTRAAKTTLTLILLISAAVHLQAQPASSQDSLQIVQEEAVRRQAATLQMRFKLADAQTAQKSNRLNDAVKLYQEAVALFPSVQIGNEQVEAEKKQALAGLIAVRTQLAKQAESRGQLAEANEQVSNALRVDPKNESLRQLKAQIDREAADQQGRVPSPELVKTIPAIQKEKIDVATQVQNAKLLYEMGKYDEAEAILKEVVKKDPSNRAAYYYLDLIKESRFSDRAKAREAAAKTSLVKVEDAWIPPTKQEALPTPNGYATTNLVFTSKGRQEIMAKLDRIRLNEVSYDLPLSEVLKLLRDESKKRDPDQTGINFLINPHADAVSGASAPIDATGAAPAPGAAAAAAAAAPVAAPAVDLSQVTIKISPPLNNLRLADVLDVITKVADVPIKYTIEDYAVMFSPKAPEAVQLYPRNFKVDPNTFVQGLENVISVSMGGLGSSGGGRGGGGGGGNGQNSSFVDIPRVAVAGGGGGGGGRGGGGASVGSGLSFVTRTNVTSGVHEMVRQYFTAAGVNLTDPGKTVFFNDRTGVLFVRASLQDLEIIAAAVETLNQAPPQLTIEAKFTEFGQDDSKALGFDWFLGNWVMNHGTIGTQAGTAPSFMGTPSYANPSGIFPGAGTVDPVTGAATSTTAIAPSPSDGLLTSGLRQTSGNDAVPAVATVTGILTDPQFRVVIRALEQRSGSDLLSAPKITTVSGRQAHIGVQDLVQIVTGVDLQQTSSGGGSGTTGGSAGNGVIGSFSNYQTESMPFGPVLDVMPTVSADGYSIQMVMIPTITEFLGYDNPGQFVPQAQSVSGTLGIPLTAVLPLPRLRMRQVVTTCNVWDGQTVVLGGLISEDIKKIKDKVPLLGDLPFIGRLFRSESSASSKKNLMVFVTPTIIDPAGNRLHSEEEMPFARNSFPAQPQSTQAPARTTAQ